MTLILLVFAFLILAVWVAVNAHANRTRIENWRAVESRRDHRI